MNVTKLCLLVYYNQQAISNYINKPGEKNMRFKFVIYTIILLFITKFTVLADPVDDFLNAELQRQRIPGAALAIINNGKIVKAQGYGLANVELNVPVTTETVFKIGSVSKQFIATGIMLLAAEGKINLDDKISKYLEGTPETWKDISIRHLLTHTSGLLREAPGFDPSKIQTDLDVIKTAYSQPLRFVPGEKWEYCNVGYFSLAEIIRKVSGKPWGDYLNEQVFAPLGMTATRPTTVAEIIPKRANSYNLQNEKLINAENWPAVRPSGAFLSNILDLAKWEAALNENKILNQAIRTQMWTPVTLNDGKKYPYGFGWELNDFRGVSTIQHGGTLTGFRAQYLRFPEQGLTVIVLANLGSANVYGLATGVALEYIPQLKLSSLPPQPTPNADMTKTFKTFLESLAGSATEFPQVTSELNAIFKNFPQASRNALGERLKQQKSFDFLMQRDVKEKKIQRFGTDVTNLWFYRMATDSQTFYYTFYLTANGKIADLEASVR
jgi:D-alanyl-D-alanine carboxypeptidase